MTTIAINANEIAADGLHTWGNEIRGMSFPKLRRDGATIYGLTGWAAMFDALIAWHKAGADPKDVPPSDGDWTLIVVDRPGWVAKYTKGCPYRDELSLSVPIGFGSGGDYAAGAMWAGKTPSEAVALVSEYLSDSGGAITVFQIQPELREAAE